MKKFIYFFAIFAYVVGAIGGLGWTLYCKAWFIAACVVILAVMAFPTLKDCFNKLMA